MEDQKIITSDGAEQAAPDAGEKTASGDNVIPIDRITDKHTAEAAKAGKADKPEKTWKAGVRPLNYTRVPRRENRPKYNNIDTIRCQ